MKRLQWMQTEHGWRCDAYQIELLAPGFWVLSQHSGRSPWPEVIASGGSLKGLKRRAWRLEARLRGRRRLVSYLAWLAASVILAAAVHGIQTLFVMAIVVVFLLTLRVIGFWVGLTTGRGWNRLADTYQ
ncbi:MAG: hypothetical protein WB239_16855 [Acidimicrobiia bacterium]